MHHHSVTKYQSLKDELQLEIHLLKFNIYTYSYLRLAVFALAVLMAYLFFDKGLLALSIIAVVMIVVFLILIKKQVNYQSIYEFTATKLALVENEIEVAGDGTNIYPNGNEY